MNNEQRDYFRIKDSVLLRFKPVEKQAALSNSVPTEFSNSPGYALMNELEAIENDGIALLHNIAEHNRDVEAYLKLINKKLDCISSHLIAQHHHNDIQEPVDITISEGGLAFTDKSNYQENSYAAIQLTLQPSKKSIVVFGVVLSCNHIDDEKYSIAVNFVNLKEPVRQQIAKYVLQFQLAEKRRAQKEGQE